VSLAGPYVPHLYPAATTGTTPASWPCPFDPGHPLHRKPLHSKGFHPPTASACFRNGDYWYLAGPCVRRRHGRPQPGKLAMPVRSPVNRLIDSGFDIPAAHRPDLTIGY